MVIRTGEADWAGAITDGIGRARTESGALDSEFSARSRFGAKPGTNPEELIAAAHASCYSLALAKRLGDLRFEADAIHTSARVRLEPQSGGHSITRIELTTEAYVPGIEEQRFQDIANWAKENCPVSKLLRQGTEITLTAVLRTQPNQLAAYG